MFYFKMVDVQNGVCSEKNGNVSSWGQWITELHLNRKGIHSVFKVFHVAEFLFMMNSSVEFESQVFTQRWWLPQYGAHNWIAVVSLTSAWLVPPSYSIWCNMQHLQPFCRDIESVRSGTHSRVSTHKRSHLAKLTPAPQDGLQGEHPMYHQEVSENLSFRFAPQHSSCC